MTPPLCPNSGNPVDVVLARVHARITTQNLLRTRHDLPAATSPEYGGRERMWHLDLAVEALRNSESEADRADLLLEVAAQAVAWATALDAETAENPAA